MSAVEEMDMPVAEIAPQVAYEQQRDGLVAMFQSDPDARDKALAEIYLALKSFEAMMVSMQQAGGPMSILKMIRGKQ